MPILATTFILDIGRMTALLVPETLVTPLGRTQIPRHILAFQLVCNVSISFVQ